MSTNQAKPVVVLREPVSGMSRHLMRVLPASLVSIAVHAGLLFLFFLVIPASQADSRPDETRIDDSMMADDPQEDRKASFMSDDPNPDGLEPDINSNLPLDPRSDETIPGIPNPLDDPGFKNPNKDNPLKNIPIPGGMGLWGEGGAVELPGAGGTSKADGLPGGLNERGLPFLPGSMNGRGAGTREFSLRTGGGTDASERAVGLGLKWLARQQLADGRWSFNSASLPERERGAEVNDVAATALGLLPLLAAGKTHKPGHDNLYDKTVDKGLRFLIRSQDKTGYFGISMYAHGLATIAMCEAYGLTQDPALRRSAQSGLNLIINTQHETGGWRYGPRKELGDMSISGWQIMALKSGQMAGLDVPTIAVARAKSFLQSCCNADEGYGYIANSASKPRMTAVGLLCRQYMESWGPAHPRMIKSIAAHIKPNAPDRQDVYYYYYATQVMHHFGGAEWREWNEKMREYLIAKQDVNQSSANIGSWSPVGDEFGRAGGRLMMTSFNLLTLEVYYRYLPLYYRDAGYKMDAAAK